MRDSKIVSVVSAGIIIGSFIGFIRACYFVLSNGYIQYEMFRLSAVIFQKNMNYSMLLAIMALMGLWGLWFACTVKMKFDKKRVMRVFQLIFVILLTGVITDWTLREFTGVPLIYGIKDLLRMIHDYAFGGMTLKLFLLKSRIFLMEYMILTGCGIVAIPFIYRLLRRLSLDDITHFLQKRYVTGTAAALLALILIFNVSLFADQKINGPEGPNVIFIVVDTLRADHVSAYGYDRLTTPNIDSLVNDGIMFQNAVSQGNRTTLSMPSIFTGLYTSDHGYHMFRKIESRFAPISERFTTIAEVLSDAGYVTQAVSCQPWVSPESGYGQGFDGFSIVSVVFDSLSDQKTVKRAVEWLDDNANKKFFLFLNLMGPHTPYNPLPPYDTLYAPEYNGSSKLITELNNYYREDKHREYYSFLEGAKKENISSYDVNHLMALYDGKINFTDVQIGVLIEKLKALNIYTNTLIVLTADHGEAFLEHDKLLHGRSLYNEEIHVPLIMTYADGLPEGRKVNSTVELVDVFPTIASITGVSVSGIKMRGNSLYPLADNPYYSNAFGYSEGSGLMKYMTDEWSLICRIKNLDCELYDLKNDYEEMNNLLKKKPDIAEDMTKRLFGVVSSKMYPTINSVKAGVISDEKRKTLKSLGYLR